MLLFQVNCFKQCSFFSFGEFCICSSYSRSVLDIECLSPYLLHCFTVLLKQLFINRFELNCVFSTHTPQLYYLKIVSLWDFFLFDEVTERFITLVRLRYIFIILVVFLVDRWMNYIQYTHIYWTYWNKIWKKRRSIRLQQIVQMKIYSHTHNNYYLLLRLLR